MNYSHKASQRGFFSFNLIDQNQILSYHEAKFSYPFEILFFGVCDSWNSARNCLSCLFAIQGEDQSVFVSDVAGAGVGFLDG